jgi:hypothetical protein
VTVAAVEMTRTSSLPQYWVGSVVRRVLVLLLLLVVIGTTSPQHSTKEEGQQQQQQPLVAAPNIEGQWRVQVPAGWAAMAKGAAADSAAAVNYLHLHLNLHLNFH